MRRNAWLVLLGAMLPGCVTHLCQSDLDHFYAAYGGRRARADMVRGRVGSILDPALEVGADGSPIGEVGPWLESRASTRSHPRSAVSQASQQDGPKLISPTRGEIVASIGPPDAN